MNIIFFKRILLYLFFFIIFISCSDINQNHTGEAGHSCYEDGSCDNKLVCIEGKVCSDLCSKIDCSNGVCSIEDGLPICNCDSDYFLDTKTSRCLFDCSSIIGSHLNSSNNGCDCDENFVINEESNLCVFDCSALAFSHPNDTNDGCSCDRDYTLENDSCILNCNKEHSHVNDTNTACDCDNNYILDEDSNSCIFNCSALAFSRPNDTNDGCSCNDDYSLKNDICIFNCNKEYSHVNDTNTACDCDNNYIFNEESDSCVFDCSTLAFSHPNDRNNGCSCDSNYIMGDDGSCIYDCSEFPHSHANEVNNGCSCDDNYQDNDNSATCLEDCNLALDRLDCDYSCDDRSGVATCSCDDYITRENLNNSQENAYIITLDENNSFIKENLTTGVSDCDLDNVEDWYKVHIEPWSKLYVRIDFTHRNGNLDLELLDNEESLAVSHHSGVDGNGNPINNEYIYSYNEVTGKDFYIKVYHAFNHYKLTVRSTLLYSSHSYNDHEYRYFEDYEKKWEDAKIACESQNYHLATVTDSMENSWIQDWVGGSFLDTAWIGLDRENDDSDWRWVTDEIFNYHDEMKRSLMGSGDCVAITDTEWRETRCSSRESFICEEN